jgi:Fic family protein
VKIPANPPSFDSLLSQVDPKRLPLILENTRLSRRYLHWDELRRRKPPADLDLDEWWLGEKLTRSSNRRFLPFRDTSGLRFSYSLPDEAYRLLHSIDSLASGQVVAPQEIVSAPTRDQYLVSSLMEEAISSSLLEGAATTRQEAKLLLRSGREPASKAERMVVNNYRTMQLIRADLAELLTADMILDIHRTVTEGTLDDPSQAGRIQIPEDERVVVGDDIEGIVYHRPPAAVELPQRMDDLVAFANQGDTDGDAFVHPVVRAIVLHFWLSYDHPFVDGNGRTARALFYRSMLTSGYWLAEFLSISRLLYKAPHQYLRAFLFTETDDADLTYFILHQLDVLRRAIDELYGYLESRAARLGQVERLLGRSGRFNRRQLDLLAHALKRPDGVYTFRTHQTSHGVVYQTARDDLLELEEMGLLDRGKVGREFRFYPADDLEAQIEAIGDESS